LPRDAPISDVAFVQQRDLEPAAREPVSDRRADEAAADDQTIETRHGEEMKRALRA
jgi:hypothetical protein